MKYNQLISTAYPHQPKTHVLVLFMYFYHFESNMNWGHLNMKFEPEINNRFVAEDFGMMDGWID